MPNALQLFLDNAATTGGPASTFFQQYGLAKKRALEAQRQQMMKDQFNATLPIKQMGALTGVQNAQTSAGRLGLAMKKGSWEMDPNRVTESIMKSGVARGDIEPSSAINIQNNMGQAQQMMGPAEVGARMHQVEQAGAKKAAQEAEATKGFGVRQGLHTNALQDRKDKGLLPEPFTFGQRADLIKQHTISNLQQKKAGLTERAAQIKGYMSKGDMRSASDAFDTMIQELGGGGAPQSAPPTGGNDAESNPALHQAINGKSDAEAKQIIDEFKRIGRLP